MHTLYILYSTSPMGLFRNNTINLPIKLPRLNCAHEVYYNNIVKFTLKIENIKIFKTPLISTTCIPLSLQELPARKLPLFPGFSYCKL